MTAAHGYPALDERDQAIVDARAIEYAAIEGPRVGDYLRFPDGALIRVAHVWDGEGVQPSCERFGRGSYYLGSTMGGGGFCSYSGSLDPLVPVSALTRTDETKPGSVWIFHHNHPCGGGGRDTAIPFRIYACSVEQHRPGVLPGALAGIAF